MTIPLSLSPTVWYKADAGTGTTENGAHVETWADQSGNGNDGTTSATAEARPTYQTAVQNGLPALKFVRTANQFVRVPGLGALTEGSVFLVVQAAAVGQAFSGGGLWSMGSSLAAENDTYYSWEDNIIYDDCGTTVRKSTVEPPVSIAEWNIYEVISAPGAWTSWMNGVQLFTTATNTVGFPSPGRLGGNGSGAAWFSGDIGELLVFPTALSSTHRQEVEAYLKKKWFPVETMELFQAVAGGLSFAGSVHKKPSRRLTGGSSFAGNFLRSHLVSFIAGLSFQLHQLGFAGIGGVRESIGGSMIGGGLSEEEGVGAPPLVKQVRRAEAGGLSFTGLLTRVEILFLALTAALSFTGAAPRRITRVLSGGAGFTGSTAKLLARQLTAAALGFTGSCVKQGKKNLTAGLSYAGSISRQIFYTMAAVLSFTGSCGKSAARKFTAALSFTGSCAKQLARKLANAGLSFAGSAKKQTLRGLSGTLNFAGFFLPSPVTEFIEKSLEATLFLVGSVSKRPGKAASAGLGFAGSMRRSLTYPLSATASFVGEIGRRSSRALVGGVSFTGGYVKSLARSVTGGTGFSGKIAKQGDKNLSSGLTFTGSMGRRFTRAISSILSFVGTQIVGFHPSVHVSGTVGFAGNLDYELNPYKGYDNLIIIFS